MRYRELCEDATLGKMFFHVTTPVRTKKILQSGIEPGHNRRWKGMYHRRPLGDRGYVYLISDFSSAVRWAAKVQWELSKKDRDQPVDILCISNLDPASIEPDPNPEGQLSHGGTWFQMKGTIDRENVVWVVPLTPELIKQAVNGGTVGLPV